MTWGCWDFRMNQAPPKLFLEHNTIPLFRLALKLVANYLPKYHRMRPKPFALKALNLSTYHLTCSSIIYIYVLRSITFNYPANQPGTWYIKCPMRLATKSASKNY
jgi:hypothetical protein